MPWEAWVLIGFYIIGAVGTICLIDRPRDPITPGVAVVTLFLAAFQVWLLLRLVGAA